VGTRALTESWSPEWAPHAVGRYEAREVDPETGLAEPQRIEMTCSVCKDTARRSCTSGQVRQHIATFARMHLHRSPLDLPPKK
jgi:hypothetical protein